LKDISLKIWPEIVDYNPAIVPFPTLDDKETSLFLEFENCTKVNASGLNLLLVQLLKLFDKKNSYRSWHAIEAEDLPLYDHLKDLGFFQYLNLYRPNQSLFSPHFQEPASHRSIIVDQTESFPIYMIDYKQFEKRRMALDPLKEWVYNHLKKYHDEFDFVLPQLITIINEIAKNSADHTHDNAFIGLDVQRPNNSEIRISFSIGDLGVGINQNIKNHIPEAILKKRQRFWDITQTYREALSRGFTTRGASKENKGLGMSLILDGAKGINLNLSVFDAKSRGILSSIDSLVHSEIRKNFYNLNREVGFFYYGELLAKKL